MKNFKLALTVKALAYSLLIMPAHSVAANNDLDDYRKILEDPNIDEQLFVASIKNYMLVVKESEVVRKDDIHYIQNALYKYNSKFDEDEQLLFLNADLYMMQGNNEEALEYTIQVLEKTTNSHLYDVAFISAMRLAYITSEWKKASELYNRYVHQASRNGRFYGTLVLSGSLSRLERHSEAVDYAARVYLNYFDTASQDASERNLLSVARSAYLYDKAVIFDNQQLNEIELEFANQWLESYVVEERVDIISELLWHFGKHLTRVDEEKKFSFALESIGIDLELSMYQMAVLKAYELAQRNFNAESVNQLQQDWLNKEGIHLSELALSIQMEHRAQKAFALATAITSQSIIESSEYHELLGDIYLEMEAYEEAQSYYLAAISIREQADKQVFAKELYEKRISALRLGENRLLLPPVIKQYLMNTLNSGELIEQEDFNYVRNLFAVYLNEQSSTLGVDELLLTIYQNSTEFNAQELDIFDMAIAHAETLGNELSVQEYVYGAMTKANTSLKARYIEKFIQTSIDYFSEGQELDQLVAYEQIYQITGDETVISNFASNLITNGNFGQLEILFERYPNIAVLGLDNKTKRYAYLYRLYSDSGDNENVMRTLRWLADNAQPMNDQIAYHRVLLSQFMEQTTDEFYEEAEAYLSKLGHFDDFDKRLLASNVKTDYFIKSQDSSISRLEPISGAENSDLYGTVLALYHYDSDTFKKEQIREVADLRAFIGRAQREIKQLNKWYQRLGSDQDYRWLVDYHRANTNLIASQTLNEFSQQLEGRAAEQVVSFAGRFMQQSKDILGKVNMNKLRQLVEAHPNSRYVALKESFESIKDANGKEGAL